MAQWVKDLALSLLWLGRYCGTCLMPSLGTSVCQGLKKKKKKKVHEHRNKLSSSERTLS